jgi:hypothetical protein
MLFEELPVNKRTNKIYEGILWFLDDLGCQ